MKNTVLKRILLAVMALLMALSFVACSSSKTCKICSKEFEPTEKNEHGSVDGTVYICDDCMDTAK